MFSADQPDKQIAALGETSLIEAIRNWLGTASPPAPEGTGDDCAILEPIRKGSQLLTTDALTYQQHFDDSVSPEAAGAKLIKRNISDIAAMGGVPKAAVLALLAGPDLSIDWLQKFFAGVATASKQYGIQIVGGDVSSIQKGHFSAVLSLTGGSHQPALRSSAKIGDSIYVTGSLGGSILKKHYDFEPRLKEGQWLAQHTACTAMMDLTDGLSKDLLAILPASGCAALRMDQIPIAADAIQLSKSSQRSPLEHAFIDGEDYELLFTLSATSDQTAFENEWRTAFPKLEIHAIGALQHPEQPEHRLLNASTGQIIPWSNGFEHFSQCQPKTS
ncbi:MAG: thiamine-phosphate kinase [Verrucomicrobiota bacterium]